MADKTTQVSFASPNDFTDWLDANLQRSANWHRSVGGNKFFRIAGFAKVFDQLPTNWSDGYTIEQTFRNRASATLSKLQSQGHAWIKDTSFSKSQLAQAQNHQPMRFDKALACVLTLNELLTEAGLEAALLEKHCITACCFEFVGLAGHISTAAEEYQSVLGETTLASAQAKVILYLANQSNQQVPTIQKMAGLVNASPSAKRTVLASGSYPVMRSIFKAIEQFPSVSVTLSNLDRMQIIRPRSSGGSQMTALAEENLIEPGRITRPPYSWLSDEVLKTYEESDGDYPPEVNPADPLAPATSS
jgi:hypothetical protein